MVLPQSHLITLNVFYHTILDYSMPFGYFGNIINENIKRPYIISYLLHYYLFDARITIIIMTN